MVKLIENMDSGTRKTPLCKTQQRYISSAIRKIKNDEYKLNHGHFYTSGMIRRKNLIVYFSTSDFRYFPNQAYVRYVKEMNNYNNSNIIGRNIQTSIEHLDVLLNSALKGDLLCGQE